MKGQKRQCMATMIVSSYKYIKGAKVHCRKGSPGVHGAS